MPRLWQSENLGRFLIAPWMMEKGGGGHVDTYNGVLQLHTFYSYFSHIKGLLLSSVNDISVHNLASYYKAAKHLENVCSLFIS